MNIVWSACGQCACCVCLRVRVLLAAATSRHRTIMVIWKKNTISLSEKCERQKAKGARKHKEGVCEWFVGYVSHRSSCGWLYHWILPDTWQHAKSKFPADTTRGISLCLMPRRPPSSLLLLLFLAFLACFGFTIHIMLRCVQQHPSSTPSLYSLLCFTLWHAPPPVISIFCMICAYDISSTQSSDVELGDSH